MLKHAMRQRIFSRAQLQTIARGVISDDIAPLPRAGLSLCRRPYQSSNPGPHIEGRPPASRFSLVNSAAVAEYEQSRRQQSEFIN